MNCNLCNSINYKKRDENEAFSYFTYWSYNLYLYTQHTLGLLEKKVDLKVYFIKYRQRYPLSNHLYWLSKNKLSGHDIWSNSLSSTDTTIACISKDNE